MARKSAELIRSYEAAGYEVRTGGNGHHKVYDGGRFVTSFAASPSSARSERIDRIRLGQVLAGQPLLGRRGLDRAVRDPVEAETPAQEAPAAFVRKTRVPVREPMRFEPARPVPAPRATGTWMPGRRDKSAGNWVRNEERREASRDEPGTPCIRCTSMMGRDDRWLLFAASGSRVEVESWRRRFGMYMPAIRDGESGQWSVPMLFCRACAPQTAVRFTGVGCTAAFLGCSPGSYPMWAAIFGDVDADFVKLHDSLRPAGGRA